MGSLYENMLYNLLG